LIDHLVPSALPAFRADCTQKPKFVVAASVEVGRNSVIASSDPLVSTPVDGGADGVNTGAPLPQTPAEVQQIVALFYPLLR
jgi:hypothetical protein